MEEKEKMVLMKEGEMLEQKLKFLGKRLEQLSMVLMELGKAKESIKGIEVEKEALLPIGGEILARAKFISESIIFPIGAGYYLEVEKESAKERIDKIIENINGEYKSIKEEVRKSEDQLINLLRKVQQG